jgi:hypothetical protein
VIEVIQAYSQIDGAIATSYSLDLPHAERRIGSTFQYHLSYYLSCEIASSQIPHLITTKLHHNPADSVTVAPAGIALCTDD